MEFDRNFVAYVNSLLPPEEQIQSKEGCGGESVGARRVCQQAAPPNNERTAARKKVYSPAPKKRPIVSAENEHDETDEAVDELLSSLFPKSQTK